MNRRLDGRVVTPEQRETLPRRMSYGQATGVRGATVPAPNEPVPHELRPRTRYQKPALGEG